MSIRVIIVDDHRIVRQGLRSLLEKEQGIEVVGEAESGRTMLTLVEDVAPDVVIIDVAMPGLNGIEATRKVVGKAPSTKVIALSIYSDKRLVIEMLRAGASGYLLKDCAFEDLSRAIYAVTMGRTYLSPELVDIVVKDYIEHQTLRSNSAFSILTSRQIEVLQLLAEGKGMDEVGKVLFISRKTVETHRHEIMNKLGLRSVAELVKYAIREGLTSAVR